MNIVDSPDPPDVALSAIKEMMALYISPMLHKVIDSVHSLKVLQYCRFRNMLQCNHNLGLKKTAAFLILYLFPPASL
jgi:hypothetical protein